MVSGLRSASPETLLRACTTSARLRSVHAERAASLLLRFKANAWSTLCLDRLYVLQPISSGGDPAPRDSLHEVFGLSTILLPDQANATNLAARFRAHCPDVRCRYGGAPPGDQPHGCGLVNFRIANVVCMWGLCSARDGPSGPMAVLTGLRGATVREIAAVQCTQV